MAKNINAAFSEFLKVVDKKENEITIAYIREAYTRIMDKWPVWTGYSKANNRISVTGTPIKRLEPSKRPKLPGALVGKAESVRQRELSKLAQLPLNKTHRNRTILIGNSVPYAANFNFGGEAYTGKSGLQIYTEAAREATAVVKGKK